MLTPCSHTNAGPVPTWLPLLLLAALFVPAAAFADECCGDWSQPYVCDVALRVSDGGSILNVSWQRGLRLVPGQRVDLVAEARDQRGRRFPDDRFRFELELEPSCASLLTASTSVNGGVAVQAQDRAGRCNAVVWIPGNLNLEWRMPIAVDVAVAPPVAAQAAQPGREHVFLATSLYKSLLGRDPDQDGLAAACGELAKGRLTQQLDAMIASHEFRRRIDTRSPTALLEDFYQGLLGRPADTGSRGYLRDMQRHQYANVLLSIIRSDEYQQRMQRESR